MTTIDFGNLDYHRGLIKRNVPTLIEGQSFEFVSAPDLNYNCLAWALSYDNHYLDKGNGCYWPWKDASAETADGWARVCEHHEFTIVVDNNYEFVKGIEKVAILRNEAGELHAARQDCAGKWKSKMGIGPDIDHVDLACIESLYGKVVYVLQKARPDWGTNGI